jgi:hypothetical protein
MGLEKALSSIHAANRDPGITLRQAALIAGLGLLVMGLAAPFAEFFVYPKLVIPGNIEETAQNILAYKGTFSCWTILLLDHIYLRCACCLGALCLA